MATQKKAVSKTTKKSSRDPILLSTLAHLSILATLVIPFVAMVIPLLIWLLERNKPDRSEMIEFHAKQAFFYQVAIYLITGLLTVITVILSMILIGLILIPVVFIFPLIAIGYGVYGGIRVSQGENFRYIYIADFIDAG
jgi:uncharacterized Tic20 family protein